MAVYSIKKVLALPAEASTNTVYYVKGEADSRVKLYVSDTAGTVYPVGILDGTDVLSTLLSGYSVGSDIAISSADSILQAFQKVQGQLNALSTSVSQGMKVPLPLDCSTEPNYPVAEAGDSYKVTVAGKIGGASGIIVQVGDLITASTDNGGGTQAAVGSQWFILQANTDNATESVTGLTRIATSGEVTAGSEAFAYVTPLRLKGRLDLKQDTITGGASTITTTDLTANRALISSGSGKVAVSAVTTTELGYVSGATSNLQTQLNALVTAGSGYVPTARTLTINGTAYDLSANRTWTIPTHDAVTLGTPNGLSLSTQVLSLALASTSTTGALSSSDWNTFNSKQSALTNPITGTGIANAIAYFNGAGTITGDNKLTYDSTTSIIDINGVSVFPKLTLRANSQTSSISEIGRRTGGALYLSQIGAFPIEFDTTNTLRWSILSSGILQSNGAQTIQSSSGELTLQPAGGLTNGINATANINLYSSAGLGIIRNTVSTGAVVISGSSVYTEGGRIDLYGSTHATTPNRIDLRSNNTIQFSIDSSVVDVPTNYLQARGGITNTGLGQSPLNTGPILTYTLTSGGSGYVNGTYTNVALSAGSGGVSNYALFDITVAGGIVTVATLKHAGQRLVTGEQYTINNTLLGGTGSGLIITVDTVEGADLYLAKAGAPTVRLENTSTSMSAGTVISQILFAHRDGSIYGSGDRAAIIARASSTAGGGYIDFETSSATATDASTNRLVALRVTNNRINILDGTAAVPSLGFISDLDTGLYSVGTNSLGISTGGVLRWTIGATGTLESNGTQTIQTSTGNLTLATSAGNGNIILTPHGTGAVQYNASNAAGDIVTIDASNYLRRRTVAQILGDINSYSTIYNAANYSVNTNVDLNNAANSTFYAGSSATNKYNGNGQVASFVSSVSAALYGFQIQMQAGVNSKFGVRRIDAGTFGSWAEIITESSIANAPAATVDTDKFLVNDSGTLKYRTGSELLSDIGAVTTARTVTAGTGLTGGGALSSNISLALTGQSLAVHNLATNGFIVRTGSGTVAARSVTSTGLTVTNGNGVSGNINIEMEWNELGW